MRYAGEWFSLRSYLKREDEIVFVLRTRKLQGSGGDELPASMCEAVVFSDGSTLIPAKSACVGI